MGQIKAELGYWEKKPAIVLKASTPRSANRDKRYLIPLDHVWQFSEDHYEPFDSKMPKTFEGFILAKCLDLFELFDLGAPNTRQIAELAFLIEDSIDQLLKMPPEEPPKPKVVGDAKMTIDGHEMETELTE